MSYAFNNVAEAAKQQHHCLGLTFNVHSLHVLSQMLMAPREVLWGTRILEVGAGGGSFATLLADLVGPNGRVTATDLDPHLIQPHPQLDIVQHDAIADGPLPGNNYDIVHARLVLMHVPAPHNVALLRNMFRAAKIGGLVMVEDFWPIPADHVVARAPDVATAAVLRKWQAAHRMILTQAGGDAAWALRAFGWMSQLQASHIDTYTHATVWRGGESGALVQQANLTLLYPELLSYMDASEIQAAHDALGDPRVAIHGHPMVSTGGIRTSRVG